jgi:hypothetical protein
MVEVQATYGTFWVEGEVQKVKGQKSILKVEDHDLDGLPILSIRSSGDQSMTRAEAANNIYILHVLQGKEDFLTNPWTKILYGSGQDVVWPAVPTNKSSKPPPIVQDPDSPQLNPSQELVVTTMLSPLSANQVLVVQGPPGTGKVRLTCHGFWVKLTLYSQDFCHCYFCQLCYKCSATTWWYMAGGPVQYCCQKHCREVTPLRLQGLQALGVQGVS